MFELSTRSGNMPAARKRRLWTFGQRVYVKGGPFAHCSTVKLVALTQRAPAHLLKIFARLTPVTLVESQIEAARVGH
jgi:hypothetical protein